jgi:hypothetical protein
MLTNEQLLKEYNFDATAKERETHINIDIYGQVITVYTSHNATARRLYKRLGKHEQKNSGGAEWQLPMKKASKVLNGSIFKAVRELRAE